MTRKRTFSLFVGVLAFGAPFAEGAALPTGFAETLVVSGLASPSAMAFAPDGRLFVCEQAGRLRVVKDGSLLAAPFVTLSVDSSGERGLLGVAFDPDFAANAYVYVYYTATSPAVHNRLSRFTADGDVAVPGSELVLLELDNLTSATNHNGGAIHFGPDGQLYVAVGDNANGSNAQTLANLLGKILRLGSDGSIPTDNPFYDSASGANRSIWALGLRNPFTFAFHRVSGRMFINDVGQSTWEEINDGVAGSNYGWPTTEGPTSDPRFRSPLFAYGHGGGTSGGCAITGGAFYDAPTRPFPASYHDDYFFADFCSGWIRTYDPADGSVGLFATGISSPVDLKLQPDGSLYYLARGTGSVFRVRFTAGQAPTIAAHPSDVTVSEGRPATFTVGASGTAPLGYQWQRDGMDIAGATGTSYTLAVPQLGDDGALFRCVVSNAFGTATSNTARLSVILDRPPTATITLPPAGTLYTAGDTLNYAGTGTDPEDGALPASAFTWQVDFHHDGHTHPFVQPTTGATSGSFVIPSSGETDPNVFYRIQLTLRDSADNTHQAFRDVLPRTATIRIDTVPSGLSVLLDGQPGPTPRSFVGVAGIVRNLAAPSPQLVSGTTWLFASWSDGGAQAHDIATPAVNATYTATYQKARAVVVSPAPGSTLPSPTASFTWTSGTGVAEYSLSVGTTPGGTDIHDGAPGTALTQIVSGLPADGSTLHVRLASRLATGWEFDDYTYHAASAPASEDVVWTRAEGVSVSGNSLTKTAPAGWGNAGAASTKALASGDGYVEFVASETNTYRRLGLGRSDPDLSWQSIDHSLYLRADGRLRAYERGVPRGKLASYSTNDVLRIAVESGVVTYRKNGAVLYTSRVAPGFPLLVDSSLYTTGATLTNVVVSGSLIDAPPPPPPPTPEGEAVVWTNEAGVAVSGNNLTKTSVAGWGNAGAASTKVLATSDGYVEFAASETTSYRMLGLSRTDPDRSWQSLDFALYLRADRSVLIYERGVNRGSFGSYSTNDVLRVAVEAGVVRYRRNGALLYTSRVAPGFPLMVDTSLYTRGATLTNVVVSGSWSPAAAPAPGAFEHP
jgi:glucose/arabinose dehydrogenase